MLVSLTHVSCIWQECEEELTQKAEVVSRLQAKTLQIGQMLNNLQKFNHLLSDDNVNRNSPSSNSTPFSRLGKTQPQGRVRHNWVPYNDPKTKTKENGTSATTPVKDQNEKVESDSSAPSSVPEADRVTECSPLNSTADQPAANVEDSQKSQQEANPSERTENENNAVVESVNQENSETDAAWI